MKPRTQVGIVGAGPAGLLLGHLLNREGIDTVVLEARSREHVEGRIRAGVLEHGTVELLRRVGLGERLEREGLVHEGFEIAYGGRRTRVDLKHLTGGRVITVYGQQEVVKDLIAARLAAGGAIAFDAPVSGFDGIEGPAPAIRYRAEGRARSLACDFIAGCDGFHGVSRPAIPDGVLRVHETVYPFAWLGILAEAPPASHELIYARHDRGFALHSMRSPELVRAYIQCRPDEDLADWPDARIWDEHRRRLEAGGPVSLATGPVLQKGVTPMRSFVAEPMQHGRLFLAGDAAHIVPPTGAKGMNLAVADIRVLAAALTAHFRHGDDGPLHRYSAACLDRVWKGQRFSWWMTSMLHRFPDPDSFEARVRKAELDYVLGSRAALASLAENYVGLPFEGPV